jgi:hypothetical protein
MIVSDSTGRIELANDYAKRILDIHQTDVIGRKFSEVVCLRSRMTGVLAGELIQLAVLQGGTMDIGNDLSVAASGCQDDEGNVCERILPGAAPARRFEAAGTRLSASSRSERPQRLAPGPGRLR